MPRTWKEVEERHAQYVREESPSVKRWRELQEARSAVPSLEIDLLERSDSADGRDQSDETVKRKIESPTICLNSSDEAVDQRIYGPVLRDLHEANKDIQTEAA